MRNLATTYAAVRNRQSEKHSAKRCFSDCVSGFAGKGAKAAINRLNINKFPPPKIDRHRPFSQSGGLMLRTDGATCPNQKPTPKPNP